MKYFILLLLLIRVSIFGVAQDNAFETDQKIKDIPEIHTHSTEAIAAFINTHFTSNTDKVRAAYTWVIHNIKYDTDSMYAINWNSGGSLKITEALRRRKGVCENFSGIFIDIVSKVGLQGVTIDGYTRQSNVVNKTGHTWSAVNLDNTWYLFDPTWDMDRMHDYRYFKISPGELANSHMPFDPLWQFNDNPITHREFQGGSSGKDFKMINHTDSIKAFMRLSELEKLHAIVRRMNKVDKTSDLIRNRKAFLEMQIATVYEEMDMTLYNTSVMYLNTATEAYNKYVSQINAKERADLSQEYEEILVPALALLNKSLERIADIGKYIPNYQYDPTGLQMRVREMADKIRLLKSPARALTKTF